MADSGTVGMGGGRGVASSGTDPALFGTADGLYMAGAKEGGAVVWPAPPLPTPWLGRSGTWGL